MSFELGKCRVSSLEGVQLRHLKSFAFLLKLKRPL